MKSALLLLAIAMILVASGCASMFPDRALAQAEAEGRLATGMTVEEVSKIVGWKPNTMTDTIRQESGGTLYWSPGFNTIQNQNWSTNYVLVFRDNKLVSWHTQSDPRFDIR